MRNYHQTILPVLLLIALLFSPVRPVWAENPLPGEPPLLPDRFLPADLSIPSQPAAPLAPARFYVRIPLVTNQVNLAADPTGSLANARTFYQQEYLSYASTPAGWTGSQASCQPGTTSLAFQQAVLRRINYFRALAGVPANVTFSADANRKAQAAALMISASGQVSHSPSTSWPCYSADASSGAGSSNLFLGEFSWNAITGYMRDPGGLNSAAGHRRWILYPQTQTMGSGDVPAAGAYSSANALVILDGHYGDPRPATRYGFVAWPPPGYVPAPLVFARWSFSYPLADFSQARVSMSSNGANVPVTLAPVTNGFGENTLVWVPYNLSDAASWPVQAINTSLSVTVSNVLVNGAVRSFSYSLTVFNP